MRTATGLAVQRVKDLAVPFEGEKGREMLLKCAGTALNSKLISRHQDLFAPMVVDAVSGLKDDLSDLNLIGVKKVPGGEGEALRGAKRRSLRTLKAFQTNSSLRSSQFVSPSSSAESPSRRLSLTQASSR